MCPDACLKHPCSHVPLSKMYILNGNNIDSFAFLQDNSDYRTRTFLSTANVWNLTPELDLETSERKRNRHYCSSLDDEIIIYAQGLCAQVAVDTIFEETCMNTNYLFPLLVCVRSAATICCSLYVNNSSAQIDRWGGRCMAGGRRIHIAYTRLPNTVVRLRRKSFSIGQNDLMQGPVLCVHFQWRCWCELWTLLWV